MPKKREALPTAAAQLKQHHPRVWHTYEELGEACSLTGPLDARFRRLVKLALAIGARSEGAVHSHTRRALEEGLSVDEIRHVAVLAIPTLGFPAGVAALTWIDDLVDSDEAAAKRRRKRFGLRAKQAHSHGIPRRAISSHRRPTDRSRGR